MESCSESISSISSKLWGIISLSPSEFLNVTWFRFFLLSGRPHTLLKGVWKYGGVYEVLIIQVISHVLLMILAVKDVPYFLQCDVGVLMTCHGRRRGEWISKWVIKVWWLLLSSSRRGGRIEACNGCPFMIVMTTIIFNWYFFPTYVK